MGDITFLQKGADVVMVRIVQQNDWSEEETTNMAREGLRTLVMARKIRLGNTAYSEFANLYHATSIKLEGRNEAMSAVVAQFLERVIFHINGLSYTTTTATSTWYYYLWLFFLPTKYYIIVLASQRQHDMTTKWITRIYGKYIFYISYFSLLANYSMYHSF